MPERLFLLAIETTCDETGAAVLEGPRPPALGVPVDPFERGRVADRPARAVRGRGPRDRRAGPCPSAPAGDRRGPPTRRGRPGRPGGDRRRHPPRPGRCAGRGPDRGQDAGPGARHPAGRGRPPRRAPLRLPARLPRSRRLPLPGAGRLGGAHQPLLVSRADRCRAPGRHDRRRGGRGLRQGGQPPRPRLSRRPRDRAGGPGREPLGVRLPAPLPPRRSARLQLLGAEDGRPLLTPRPGLRGRRGHRLLPTSWPTSPRASRRRPSTS